MLDLLASVVAGVVVTAVAFTDEERRRSALQVASLWAAPRRAIRDATASRVEKLTGQVSYLAEPLQAPLSGRRCAHYRVIVEEKRSFGIRHRWEPIFSDSAGVDFLIDDATGRARVVHESLVVMNDAKALYGSGTPSDTTSHVRAYLAEHGLRSEKAFADDRLRCLEAIVEEGETVAVMGEVGAETERDLDRGGYREVGTRVVVTSPRGGSVLVTARPELVAGWRGALGLGRATLGG